VGGGEGGGVGGGVGGGEGGGMGGGKLRRSTATCTSAPRATHTARRNPVSAKTSAGKLLAAMATGAGSSMGAAVRARARCGARAPCAPCTRRRRECPG
jgi:hypothetical protein